MFQCGIIVGSKLAQGGLCDGWHLGVASAKNFSLEYEVVAAEVDQGQDSHPLCGDFSFHLGPDRDEFLESVNAQNPYGLE